MNETLIFGGSFDPVCTPWSCRNVGSSSYPGTADANIGYPGRQRLAKARMPYAPSRHRIAMLAKLALPNITVDDRESRARSDVFGGYGT
jgi:nicotinic acid mononucleotide adenylyltransferase